MSAARNVVKLPGREPSDSRKLTGERLKIIGIVLGVALILIVTGQFIQDASDAARATEPSAVSVVRPPSPPSEYFPSQYRNNAQSASPEEHIQAF